MKGSVKGGELEGSASLRKEGIAIEAYFSEGLQEGPLKAIKKVKGEEVVYRGDFERGH